MTRPGLFLCGCDPNDPHIRHYAVTALSEDRVSWKRYNAAGDEVCPIHGMPMYGILSDAVDYVYQHFVGRDDKKPLGSPDILDLRDNRDPAEVGAAVLLERAASGNGHATALDNGRTMAAVLNPTTAPTDAVQGLDSDAPKPESGLDE